VADPDGRVIKVVLNGIDFRRLIGEMVVERDPMLAPKVKIILQDMGFAQMRTAIDEVEAEFRAREGEKTQSQGG
jgi:hypothetical protein